MIRGEKNNGIFKVINKMEHLSQLNAITSAMHVANVSRSQSVAKDTSIANHRDEESDDARSFIEHSDNEEEEFIEALAAAAKEAEGEVEAEAGGEIKAEGEVEAEGEIKAEAEGEVKAEVEVKVEAEDETEDMQTAIMATLIDMKEPVPPMQVDTKVHDNANATRAPHINKKYRAFAYDNFDKQYADQLRKNFFVTMDHDTREQFNKFTEYLMEETHINTHSLMDAVNDYALTPQALTYPLSCSFSDLAFNCRPHQPCTIC